MLHALKRGERITLVLTVDSDVHVILIDQFSSFIKLSEDYQVFISFITGSKKRIIDVKNRLPTT